MLLTIKRCFANGALAKIWKYFTIEVLNSVYFAVFYCYLIYEIEGWRQNLSSLSQLTKFQKYVVCLLSLFWLQSLHTTFTQTFRNSSYFRLDFSSQWFTGTKSSPTKQDPKHSWTNYMCSIYCTRSVSLNVVTRQSSRIKMYCLDSIRGKCMPNWNHLQSYFKDNDLVTASHCNMKKVVVILFKIEYYPLYTNNFVGIPIIDSWWWIISQSDRFDTRVTYVIFVRTFCNHLSQWIIVILTYLLLTCILNSGKFFIKIKINTRCCIFS